VTSPSARIQKGIVLAGGRGSRLYPVTLGTNKHLLPVHDKPMIYYPLSTLLLAGVRDVLVVSSESDLPSFERLLGDGSPLGVRFRYAAQGAPRGIADGLLVADDFLAGDGCALALGDNMFWGHLDFIRNALARPRGATIYAYPVQDPSRYGVVTLGEGGAVVRIEEKPATPRSHLAIPGLYVLDGDAVSIAKTLRPSERGELEITDVLRAYLGRGDLAVVPLGRGMAWLDMGTVESLRGAAELVAAIELRQGLRIGCLEECALRMKYVSKEDMRKTVARYPASPYRAYIEGLLDE
jgi:glucose-1-phosphate thymidylyltransferase